MEVLSVNCNKCGGVRPNGKGEIYDTLIVEQIKNMVEDFLELEENNVIFFNEINNAENNFKAFENLFDEEKYIIHKPSNFEAFNNKNHPYGFTIAITKRFSVWEKTRAIELIDRKSGDLSYANKSVALQNGDIILLGVHIPYDIEYWDEIINYFEENHEKRIYIVGDYNVFDESNRKLKFEELKTKGAIDVWLNMGGDNSHITCTTGKRLDYLLSSVIGVSSIKKMGYIDSLRLNGFTDHSGVLFEVER
ncbi:hypothetical protein [Ligilactobacillus ruminis]|uniref:hypothetical protein n=1 Tax=Ligilactobacillus ruminis TaxID=1623 RepID=UPI00265B4DED|nr:hypothetical protein [Ligilactobacillus ruminis]WKB70981.1 hypothetical protein QYH55_01185 [Ligilactobacillus ruminis]